MTSPDIRAQRIPLGRTGLSVSRLALGTAALGIDYGLPTAHDFARPDFDTGVRLVRRSLDNGIKFFDTAPAYGVAEDILGEALGGADDVVVASKAGVTWDRKVATAADVRETLRCSVEASLVRLKRGRLDVLQLHSATVADLGDDRALRGLDDIRSEGLTTAVGVTVYGEAAALAAVRCGVIDVVQVAFNVLDQRASADVFPEAERHGTALVVRSAVLKGALTRRWRSLPPQLRGLREAVARLTDDLDLDDEELATIALRFCLSYTPPITSVLIGAASAGELDTAISAAVAGPLAPECLLRLSRHALNDEALLNPSHWT